MHDWNGLEFSERLCHYVCVEWCVFRWGWGGGHRYLMKFHGLNLPEHLVGGGGGSGKDGTVVRARASHLSPTTRRLVTELPLQLLVDYGTDFKYT